MATDQDARIDELETRLAFQEQALSQMSDALADARAEILRQGELLRRALEQVRQNGGELYADPADEPPPPHY